MSYSDIYEMLSNIAYRIITNYLLGRVTIQGEVGVGEENIDNNDEEVFLLSPIKELIKEVEDDLHVIEEEVIGIDGSSRSLILMNGLLSVGAVSAYSSINGVLGTYPSLYGMKGLKIEAPFIAISPTFKYDSNSLEPYIYSSKFIMTTSLDGSLLIGNDAERVEAELRFILETEAINSLRDKKKFIIIDGPLFPSFINIKQSLREKITQTRLKSLNNNTIGVVKRLDKSRLLLRVLSRYRNEIFSKYKLDPLKYLSDESFLFNIARFNETPPYKKLIIGPILKLVGGDIKTYINYLIIPVHRFLPKFSILRIETLINDEKLPRLISNMRITQDGIPSIIAIPDRTSKMVTSALLKLMKTLLESSGINSSFRSRIEAVSL